MNWSESHSVMSHSLQSHGLYSPRNSLGQNTGVGSLSLLQWIFPTQGLNPGLPHCRWILYQLSHQGSSKTGLEVKWRNCGSGCGKLFTILRFLIYCNNQFKKYITPLLRLARGALSIPLLMSMSEVVSLSFFHFNKTLLHKSSWVI